MSFRLLVCDMCGNRSNLFSHKIFDMAYLAVETRTGLVFHPSCLVAAIEDVEETTEIDMSPFVRLIGLDQYTDECHKQQFDRHRQIHMTAVLGQMALDRLKQEGQIDD